MAATMSRSITSYTVTYYGGGKRITRPYPYRAIIGLWDGQGLIAALYFHDQTSTMPDADYLPDTGQPMSHYRIEDMPRILDLLRNESPVYYQQLSNWPEMAWIRTNLEPVGEGEAAA